MNRTRAKRKFLKLDRALLRAFCLGAYMTVSTEKDDARDRAHARLAAFGRRDWRPNPWSPTGI